MNTAMITTIATDKLSPVSLLISSTRAKRGYYAINIIIRDFIASFK